VTGKHGHWLTNCCKLKYFLLLQLWWQHWQVSDCQQSAVKDQHRSKLYSFLGLIIAELGRMVVYLPVIVLLNLQVDIFLLLQPSAVNSNVRNFIIVIYECCILFSTDNEITDIQGLSNCQRLEYLSLRNNKIDHIRGLDCLPLKYLNLVSRCSLFSDCYSLLIVTTHCIPVVCDWGVMLWRNHSLSNWQE